MKKILLAGVLSMAVYSVQAQDFEIAVRNFNTSTTGSAGVDEENESIKFHDTIRNLTNNPLSGVKWKIIEHNLPAGWKVWGICDNSFCRTEAQVNEHLANPNAEEEFLPIAVNEGADIYPYFFVPATGANGTGVMKIRVYNDNQSDTITYTVQKNPSNIKGVSEDDKRVALYPNPSINGALNIAIEPSLKAKSIELYNILGARMVTKSVEAEITNMPTGQLAAGNYFVKIYGVNGELIAVRKWTKQ